MEQRHRLATVDQAGTKTTVDVVRRDDGTIRIDGYDIGEAPKQFWGDSDYEYWLDIRPDQITALAVALIREHYTGDRNADTSIRELCEKYNIEVSFDSWT